MYKHWQDYLNIQQVIYCFDAINNVILYTILSHALPISAQSNFLYIGF